MQNRLVFAWLFYHYNENLLFLRSKEIQYFILSFSKKINIITNDFTPKFQYANNYLKTFGNIWKEAHKVKTFSVLISHLTKRKTICFSFDNIVMVKEYVLCFCAQQQMHHLLCVGTCLPFIENRIFHPWTFVLLQHQVFLLSKKRIFW